MVSVLGVDLGFGGGFSQVGTTLTLIMSILFFVLVLSILVFLIYQIRVYNRKIVVFENIAGRGFMRSFTDKARVVKIGDSGEEVLYLRKKKVFRTAYGSKMAKNEYWFAIGQDGYWYNFVLGDLDAKMGMLDIEPIDRDMRLMHNAVRRNVSNQYRKQKFMEKYGTILMSGIFLLIMIFGIWFLLDKMGDIAQSISGAVQSASEVTKATAQNLAALDNIKGGSGIKPA